MAKLRGYKKADCPRSGFELDEYNVPKISAVNGKPLKKKGQGYLAIKLRIKEKPKESAMFVADE